MENRSQIRSIFGSLDTAGLTIVKGGRLLKLPQGKWVSEMNGDQIPLSPIPLQRKFHLNKNISQPQASAHNNHILLKPPTVKHAVPQSF